MPKVCQFQYFPYIFHWIQGLFLKGFLMLVFDRFWWNLYRLMQIQYALFGIGNSFNNSILKFGISNACQHQNTCIVLELYYIPGISFAKCEPNDRSWIGRSLINMLPRVFFESCLKCRNGPNYLPNHHLYPKNHIGCCFTYCECFPLYKYDNIVMHTVTIFENKSTLYGWLAWWTKDLNETCKFMFRFFLPIKKNQNRIFF